MIRADRQQRMREQGLDGSKNTGWRTGDGTDGQLTAATSLSEMLVSGDSETTKTSDAQANLSAEQFTLCALSAHMCG
jgi:hypothetical protein